MKTLPGESAICKVSNDSIGIYVLNENYSNNAMPSPQSIATFYLLNCTCIFHYEIGERQSARGETVSLCATSFPFSPASQTTLHTNSPYTEPCFCSHTTQNQNVTQSVMLHNIRIHICINNMYNNTWIHIYISCLQHFQMNNKFCFGVRAK